MGRPCGAKPDKSSTAGGTSRTAIAMAAGTAVAIGGVAWLAKKAGDENTD